MPPVGTMWLVSLLPVLFVPSWAITFRFDETAWTKGTWSDFKFTRPSSQWRIADDPKVQHSVRQLIDAGYDFVSSQGLRYGKDENGGGEDESLSGWLVHALDDVMAGEAALEPVCQGLVSSVWDKVLERVHDQETVSMEVLEWYFSDACNEVVDDVLEKYTLVREERGSGHGSSSYFLDSRPKGIKPEAKEEKAVQLACERLMKTKQRDFMTAIHSSVVEYEKLVAFFVDLKGKSVLDDEGEEDVCEDLEPQCEMWADLGECQRNPDYMVGTNTEKGHCRRSCGLCTGPESYKRFGSLVLKSRHAQNLTETSARLLAESTRKACPFSPPGERIRLRPGQLHVVRHPFPDPPSTLNPTQREVYEEIAGRCFYLNQGWWTYEVCMGVHVRQIHVDGGGNIETDIVIGSFKTRDYEMSMGMRLNERELRAMGLKGKSRPFLMEEHTGGSACMQKGVEVERKAVVRIACGEELLDRGSDDYAAISIVEPTVCEYVVTVFLPGLCRLDGFRVGDAVDDREL